MIEYEWRRVRGFPDRDRFLKLLQQFFAFLKRISCRLSPSARIRPEVPEKREEGKTVDTSDSTFLDQLLALAEANTATGEADTELHQEDLSAQFTSTLQQLEETCLTSSELDALETIKDMSGGDKDGRDEWGKARRITAKATAVSDLKRKLSLYSIDTLREYYWARHRARWEKQRIGGELKRKLRQIGVDVTGGKPRWDDERIEAGHALLDYESEEFDDLKWFKRTDKCVLALGRGED